MVDQFFVQILSLVCDWAGIEIATPGSAFRYASVVRHITDCTTQPGELLHEKNKLLIVVTRRLITSVKQDFHCWHRDSVCPESYLLFRQQIQ